ncbi:MAG: hypothetical protein WBL95_16560 [Microcoleus sp.]
MIIALFDIERSIALYDFFTGDGRSLFSYRKVERSFWHLKVDRSLWHGKVDRSLLLFLKEARSIS